MQNNNKRIGREKAGNYLLVLLTFSLDIVCFYGSRLFNEGLLHHNMSLPLDGKIPFVPFFIVFYFLAYLQWGLIYLLIAQEDRTFVKRFLLAEVIAKGISFFIFLLYPTIMVRPDIIPETIWEKMVVLLYQIDTPDNLFPSLHCLNSWYCFRVAYHMKHRGRIFLYANLILAILVCASTVLIKQHVTVDIAGGILTAEIGLWISSSLWNKERK